MFRELLLCGAHRFMKGILIDHNNDLHPSVEAAAVTRQHIINTSTSLLLVVVQLMRMVPVQINVVVRMTVVVDAVSLSNLTV
jgi:hypothetical protein